MEKDHEPSTAIFPILGTTPQHDPLIYSFLLFGGGVAIIPERNKANMLF
jgi:hypothetical protein